MEKFIKKPIPVEATKFMGAISYDEMCVDWGQAFVRVADLQNGGLLRIGNEYAEIGDYIIQLEGGGFRILKPDDFVKMYQPA